MALAMLVPNTEMTLNRSSRDKPEGKRSIPRMAAVIGDTNNVVSKKMLTSKRGPMGAYQEQSMSRKRGQAR